ncbi:hypothetical protein [Pelobacter propionicus]|jgi:hypothetical protein|uniref:hypothetical protein n=1 Tax=Pelobacter propionicus TaxID=29543 RepID=UPI000057B4BC|nr:hypothetical protein [Pelobacter propionicus]
MPQELSHNSSVIEKLNPLHYMKPEDYTAFWQKIFSTILLGFWARFFFYVLLCMAFYVGVRQRNPTLAAVCIVLAACVAYGSGVIGMASSIRW